VIYKRPPAEEFIDQGDVIDGCPIATVDHYDPAEPTRVQVAGAPNRVLVLTQTCDLANQKAAFAVVAAIRDAQVMVDKQVLKAAEIRGPIRAGRVYGWYFLPKNADLGLPEMIVDFRQLHTVRLDLLMELCRRGQRKARVQPLYREHLAKHFADTYSRIGLPGPYETD
jgi:hypothetical protein